MPPRRKSVVKQTQEPEYDTTPIREPIQPTVKQQQNTTKIKTNMNKLIAIAIAILVLTVGAVCSTSFHTVKGGEMGVKETWSGGVQQEVLQPKNYMLIPSWSQTIFNYDMTLQKYELPEYVIKSVDNQEVTITSKVLWRRDPKMLVQHHITLHDKAEQIDINPSMMSAINLHGTEYKAIDAYSGEGMVRMQKDIESTLKANQRLIADGIIIESFVLEKVELHADYIEQINGRQLAELRQSRAVQEQAAAEAEALVAKAKAQADLNTQVVAGERDAQLTIIKAEAQQSNVVIEAQGAKQQVVLAAEAAQQQQVLAAEGSKQAQVLEADGKRAALIATADGVLAQGQAEAKAKELLFAAYGTKGADVYTRIQVAQSLGTAFGNIKGYLPSDMKINVLTGNFGQALDAATGNLVVPASGEPTK